MFSWNLSCDLIWTHIMSSQYFSKIICQESANNILWKAAVENKPEKGLKINKQCLMPINLVQVFFLIKVNENTFHMKQSIKKCSRQWLYKPLISVIPARFFPPDRFLKFLKLLSLFSVCRSFRLSHLALVEVTQLRCVKPWTATWRGVIFLFRCWLMKNSFPC